MYRSHNSGPTGSLHTPNLAPCRKKKMWCVGFPKFLCVHYNTTLSPNDGHPNTCLILFLRWSIYGSLQTIIIYQKLSHCLLVANFSLLCPEFTSHPEIGSKFINCRQSYHTTTTTGIWVLISPLDRVYKIQCNYFFFLTRGPKVFLY